MTDVRATSRFLAATALSLIYCAPAVADDYGIVSADPAPITVAAGESVIGDKSGVYSTGTELNLANAGSIRGNGLNAFTSNTDAGVAFKGGPANITNSGSISGARFGVSSFYFFTDFSDPSSPVWDGRAIGSTLDNSGSIVGDSDDGVRFIGGGTVTNSGYIAGRVGTNADGVSMFSFEGQDLTSFVDIGSVTNLATGTIEGNRFGIILSNGGRVDNSGIISGNSGAVHIQAQFFDPGRVGLVTNSGTMNGAVSFTGLAAATVGNSGTIISTNGAAVRGTSPLTVNNGAGGLILGSTEAILGESASTTIVNDGTLRGNGSNNSVFGSDGGVIVTGGTADITNSGTISGQQFGISTTYHLNGATGLFEGRAIGSEVVNSGTIIGDNNDGVRLIGGGSVVNSGLIAGRVGSGADGVSMFSFDGQDLTSFVDIGSVTNLAGGTIEGNRFGIILSNGGTVDNAGTISGNSGAVHIQAQLFDPGRAGLATNSGTINGAISFYGLASATVDNSGTINGFVDFNNTESAALENGGAIGSLSGAAVRGLGLLTIINTAPGAIEGASSGIFHEGSSLVVNNSGTIHGGGTYDGFAAPPDAGITFSGGPASIANSGLILGEGFGITTAHFYNPATNLLEPRAIGSTVTNSGQIVGINNDGVRLIGGGTVTNSGLISGGVGGTFAFADGVSMFTLNGQDISGLTSIGTVTNLAGGNIEGERFGIILSAGGTVVNAGAISGATGGVHIQDGFHGASRIGTVTNSGTIDGGVSFNALASATLNNSGAITSSSGPAVSITAGPLAMVNSGLISGTGATAVLLGGGDDSVTLLTGSLINGTIDGGDGADSLTLNGKGTKAGGGEVVGSFANFETLTVTSGYWTAAGATGNFTTVHIGGGVLAVDGSIGGNIGIGALGRLTGSGTVNGSITVAGGGILAPGSGIGTLSVNGNVAFSSGAAYHVDASTKSADQLAVAGSVSIGSNVPVAVTARNGNYAPTTSYAILTATGGITGQFSGVTTELAFLTPTLVHAGNSVTLNLARNSKKFTTASSSSTLQLASAVEGLGLSSPLYAAVLGQSESGAATAFESLAGSASAAADRLLLSSDEGITLSFGEPRSPRGLFSYLSALQPGASGSAVGQQVRLGPISAIMVVGERYQQSGDARSGAAIETSFAETAVGADLGRFQLGLSARFAESELATSRTIAFPGFAETVAARGEVDARRLTLRGQYALLTGRTKLAAHASYSNDRIELSSITETGGASALAIEADERTIHRGEFGLRLSNEARLADDIVISKWIDVAARTAWGDLSGGRTARFASGSDEFRIAGSPLDSRALRLDAGIAGLAGPLGWSVNYRALLGNEQSDHSLSTALSLRF